MLKCVCIYPWEFADDLFGSVWCFSQKLGKPLAIISSNSFSSLFILFFSSGSSNYNYISLVDIVFYVPEVLSSFNHFLLFLYWVISIDPLFNSLTLSSNSVPQTSKTGNFCLHCGCFRLVWTGEYSEAKTYVNTNFIEFSSPPKIDYRPVSTAFDCSPEPSNGCFLNNFFLSYLQKIQGTLPISDMETITQILFPNLPNKRKKSIYMYIYIYI